MALRNRKRPRLTSRERGERTMHCHGFRKIYNALYFTTRQKLDFVKWNVEFVVCSDCLIAFAILLQQFVGTQCNDNNYQTREI